MRSVVPFGAFVELLQESPDAPPPSRHRRPVQALVHASAVSEETSRLSRDDGEEDRRRALEFFAPVGSTVWVKIVGVTREEEGGGGGKRPPRLRVSASMRAVSQQDGSDLDPEGRTTAPGFDARGGAGGWKQQQQGDGEGEQSHGGTVPRRRGRTEANPPLVSLQTAAGGSGRNFAWVFQNGGSPADIREAPHA